MGESIARQWSLDVVPRRAVRELASAWEEQWRARGGKAPERRPRPRKPPKAISVLDVAKQFGSVKPAIEFARGARLPPQEWAEELADEFDEDIHAMYVAYYVSDPAEAA